MSKLILYGNEARASIKSGIDAVANAVKVTLGPKGQNAFIDSEYDEVRITKDGVTVARSIQLDNEMDNAGAKVIKKVASKTADDAGDGTTTATVIAQAIVAEGAKLLAAGVNPVELKRGIQLGIAMATESFKNHSVPVSGKDDLVKIATISANGDTYVGEIIGNAIDEVGPDGVVTIETSKNIDTYVEKVSGLRFDRGYKSPYFQNNLAKGECVLENPYVLLTTQKITTIKQIEAIVSHCVSQSRPLLIISDGVDGEALQMLVLNRIRGTFASCAVGCPSFGDRRNAELEDMATVLGATVINPELNTSIENALPGVLGTCAKVVVTAKTTTIIGGTGNQDKVNNRIAEIKKSIEDESSKYNKDILRQRLAKLTGGVAILYVGAISEVELNEKKDRIEDALCASRAANEEGILPGGGIAYLNAALEIENLLKDNDNPGLKIFAKALKAPLSQIIENGYGPGTGQVAAAELSNLKNDEEGNYNIGYDAREYKLVDMIEEGILDPTKVCRTAVENAGSIAGTFLTTGTIVIEKKEEKKETNQ